MKLLKYDRAGQCCKKHMPIGFSGKHAHRFAVAMPKAKSYILFPVPLILRTLLIVIIVKDYLFMH